MEQTEQEMSAKQKAEEYAEKIGLLEPGLERDNAIFPFMKGYEAGRADLVAQAEAQSRNDRFGNDMPCIEICELKKLAGVP